MLLGVAPIMTVPLRSAVVQVAAPAAVVRQFMLPRGAVSSTGSRQFLIFGTAVSEG